MVVPRPLHAGAAAQAEGGRSRCRSCSGPVWSLPIRRRATSARSCTQIVEAAGDRIKVFGDILDFADFFLPDDKLPYDEQRSTNAFATCRGGASCSAKLKDELVSIEPFEPAAWKRSLKHASSRRAALQMAQIIHPLRVAVTGKGVGFGLFERWRFWAANNRIARIDRALARLIVALLLGWHCGDCRDIQSMPFREIRRFIFRKESTAE